MIDLTQKIELQDLASPLQAVWDASGRKIDLIAANVDEAQGAPVFTIAGRYTARGWTEWTQGFQYGAAILQFDATGDEHFLTMGREATRDRMAGHVTHFGVHDHGFNNVSTYGNLLRLAGEGRIQASEWECEFYKLALQASGAVQARRWTQLSDELGYVYSFNGPHSLFADTIRSLRALGVSHRLGHAYHGEHDENISLVDRLVQHAKTTAVYTVYYGDGRDAYDLRGRVAHESIFNLNDGQYRCPNSQQGYSPFTTWTRGLAWVMLGYAEELEFLATLPDADLEGVGGRGAVQSMMLKAAQAACDFYIEHTPTDGIPYWDTGAPELHRLGNYLERPADPYNAHEPVDSSAAAIGAQGLLRLGRYLKQAGDVDAGERYWQAGLVTARALMQAPYLDTSETHEGLILHSVYHRPNGWDHIPDGQTVPCGESSMWGDYHMRELSLYLQRLIDAGTYLTFFGTIGD